MPCARIKEGPTSKKHKDKGHTGCKYLYCKSCCHEFGVPGLCYPHRLIGQSTRHSSNQLTSTQSTEPSIQLSSTQSSESSNQLTSTQSTDASNQLTLTQSTNQVTFTQTLTQSTPSTQSISSATSFQPRKRTRLLPEQCSQSVHRVGRIISEEGESLLASARRKQEEATRKASAPSIDEGKVVSLHLVTHPSTPVISQHFPNWPSVKLNESQSLLREAQAVAGTSWNGNLLVWDEPVKNWREIGVEIPHRYTHAFRNLVICLPSQRVALSITLQDILEGLGLARTREYRG